MTKSPNHNLLRPLDGVLVVSIEQAIAAPLATRHLADQGARVIKIERAPSGNDGGGDFARNYDTRARGESSHFVWVNRGKESIALDLKAASSKEVLNALIDRADVCVQNLAPGAAARLGFDAKAIHARNPRAIVCAISGYGDDPANPGPYRNKKAYDLLIQAESGLLSITGGADEMAKTGNSIADIAAGMYAYTGILNALILRGRTGQGAALDVSMLECLAEWMSYPLYYAMDGQMPPARSGAAHATIYPYGPFDTGDGNTVMLAIQNEREWARFCADVLGDAGVATDPRFVSVALRSEHRYALKKSIHQRFSSLRIDEVEALLDAADIANARVNTMAGVWAHPQLHARARFAQVNGPQGVLPALIPPPVANTWEPRMDEIPTLGQHTQAILDELNLGRS